MECEFPVSNFSKIVAGRKNPQKQNYKYLNNFNYKTNYAC